MKKAYINLPDSELGLSDYLVKIEYMNGDTFEKKDFKLFLLKYF